MKMNPALENALRAWAQWYSRKLDRIEAGSGEGYAGSEQDLFEALGCPGVPISPEEMKALRKKFANKPKGDQGV